ncbi:MAG: hypothetical protein IPM64_17380 [Phycisphaerales bacterium]|nr:hypothetical protein [Phycisphaerales bacterium]
MNAPAAVVDNPFQSPTVAARQSDALVAVEQSRAIAETQAAMLVAKKFPRDPIAAMDRILNACARPTLAEGALYTYSRGGTEITGPSIRMAEALAQNWGNLQFGIRELEQRPGESTVEAFAWDIETNVRQVKVFQVRHWRDTKSGGYALKDSRDIYELTANQGARRLRACILGVIPGDVVEAATKQCDTTLRTKAEVTPERLANLLEKFAEFGVTKDHIEKRIQRHIDAMTPAQMVDLGKKYNSLKDGMSTAAEWFEMEPQGDAAAPVKPTSGARLREAAKSAAKRPAAAAQNSRAVTKCRRYSTSTRPRTRRSLRSCSTKRAALRSTQRRKRPSRRDG